MNGELKQNNKTTGKVGLNDLWFTGQNCKNMERDARKIKPLALNDYDLGSARTAVCILLLVVA